MDTIDIRTETRTITIIKITIDTIISLVIITIIPAMVTKTIKNIQKVVKITNQQGRKVMIRL